MLHLLREKKVGGIGIANQVAVIGGVKIHETSQRHAGIVVN
jgi:hypothetical protein